MKSIDVYGDVFCIHIEFTSSGNHHKNTTCFKIINKKIGKLPIREGTVKLNRDLNSVLSQFDKGTYSRGASAKGFFEVTHDAPGIQTPIVINERESPETLREVCKILHWRGTD